MKKNKKRTLSPYEQTHLARFGRSKVDDNIAEYGEMPVEYITGKCEFKGRVFEVGPEVLIPRVETEDLVDLIVAEVKELPGENFVIADVGCGSGAIGLSVGLELLESGVDVQVVLSDVSVEAVQMARQNLQALVPSSLQSSFEVFESDLLEKHLESTRDQIDVLIANLPYIPSQRVSILDESVREFEPHLALDGGEEGLTLIKKLLKQSQQVLSPEGLIFLEVDHTHSLDDLSEFEDQFEMQLIKDEFGQNRFVRLKRKTT